jgi:GntR family transcriptional regulator
MPFHSVDIHVPAYQRIQGAIRKRIQAGELLPGDPVASERELARAHSVSLMTARHALASLEREGLVQRRRGVGTFVAPPKIHFNKLMSYTEQMAGRGLEARTVIISCTPGILDEEIAAKLLLPPDARLLLLERLRQSADEPVALEACYLSEEKFEDISNESLRGDLQGSLFSTLERKYGILLAHADEEVDATIADARPAELMAIPRGTPLLRIRQVIYTTQDKPALYVLGLYLSGRHTLMIRRFR